MSRNKKGMVLSGFYIVVVILIAQFPLGYLISETYPALILPAFATIARPNGDIQTTERELIVICGDSSRIHVSQKEIFTFRNFQSRVNAFEEVFFQRSAQVTAQGRYARVDRIFGKTIGDIVRRLRHRPLSASQRRERLEWIYHLAREKSDCHSIARVIAVVYMVRIDPDIKSIRERRQVKAVEVYPGEAASQEVAD